MAEQTTCTSCGAAMPAAAAAYWDGLCWRCNLTWLRTHQRTEMLGGQPYVYTLRPFDEHRCLFVHIPRTAGVSIAAALFDEGGSTHAPLSALQKVFSPAEFGSYLKFTFVRNPWDRLVSAYEYLRAGTSGQQHDLQWKERLARFAGFGDFVEWIGKTGATEGMHFAPQHTYVGTDGCSMAMDFVGRFETIVQDVAHVAARLGVTVSLPHLNRAPQRRPYQDYYTSRSAEIVGEVYRRDVELFGYDFANSRFRL